MRRDVRAERNLREGGAPRRLRTKAQEDSRRGRTDSFSAPARRRYLNHVRNVPTLTHELTLTYSGRSPKDDRIVKGHLDLFKRWLSRREVGCVWRLEFDMGGRVHFHLMLTGSVDIDAAGVAWADMAGCKGSPYLVKGRAIDDRTSVEYYFAKPRGHRSNYVPEGYENMGQWWGYGGPGSRPAPLLVIEGPESDLAPLLRAAKKAQAANVAKNSLVRRRRRRDNGATGFRLYDGGGEAIARDLGRYADSLGERLSKTITGDWEKESFPAAERSPDGGHV